MKLLLFFLSSLSCSIALASSQWRVEEVYAYEIRSSIIEFQVASGGCTHKSDFTLRLKRNRLNHVNDLLLIRERPDYCYAYIPSGTIIGYSYSELGLPPDAPVAIRNPTREVRSGY